MSDLSILQAAAQARIRTRSMGVKLIVVCGLALLMAIPSFFVESLVEERTQREADVVREISGHVGGQQTFLGPTLAIPYSIPPQSPTGSAVNGIYLIFPARASAVVKTKTEEKRRSLFKVPVFQADLNFDASFDLAGVPAAAPVGAQLDWSRAEIVLGVSDARGAQADATMTANGKTSTLVPANVAPYLSIGGDGNEHAKLTLFGASAAGVARPDGQFSVVSTMRFSGAQRIALLAYGKTTNLKMEGDWRSPGFDGGFLPATHTLSDGGFSAEWSVPFIARGVRAEGPVELMGALDATALGTTFVEMADPYQSVNRSLKYVLLFLGLIFLSYFVFEVSSGKRVHPAQYFLVGIAQIIFYLLLLSLAERVGFDWGFLVAGAATVTLLSANAGWIFASRVQGWRAAAIFTSLYALIYMLLRLEDNALLVGAIASFLAVTVAMYFTRGIDWYSSLPAPGGDATVPPPPVATS